MPTVQGPLQFPFLPIAQRAPSIFVSSVLGQGELVLPWVSISSGGNPGPALRLDRVARWRWYWVVTAGTRTITADVYSPRQDFRPVLRVLAAPELGVPTTVESMAPAGTGWVQFPPIVVTPTAAGRLVVEIQGQAYYTLSRPVFDPAVDYCLVDNLTVT